MISSVRRSIVNDINGMINDFNFLLKLCDFCDNDYDLVTKMISKVIKYSYSNYVSNNISYLNDLDKIDEKYREFVKEDKVLFPFLKRKVSFDLEYSLDSDIRSIDLDGIKLPKENTIKMAIGVNKDNANERRDLINNNLERCKQARGFNEVGLTYSTYENVSFNTYTIYYHKDLTGDYKTDYYNLYRDERYRDNSNSPLKNSFKSNLESIRKNNDIEVVKFGNLYEILNGRHRILYLIRNGNNDSICINVVKRIEDREVNIILIKLKEEGFSSFKNNVNNDEIDIILRDSNNTYHINNKSDLIDFYNNKNFDKYKIGEYENISSNKVPKLLDSYLKKIMLYCIKNKDFSLLDGNYTDVYNLFGTDSNVLYNALVQAQRLYKRYNLLGINIESSHYVENLFDDELEDMLKEDKDDSKEKSGVK